MSSKEQLIVQQSVDSAQQSEPGWVIDIMDLLPEQNHALQEALALLEEANNIVPPSMPEKYSTGAHSAHGSVTKTSANGGFALYSRARNIVSQAFGDTADDEELSTFAAEFTRYYHRSSQSSEARHYLGAALRGALEAWPED